jgi:hypothetical protein
LEAAWNGTKQLQVHENKQAMAKSDQAIRISIFGESEQWNGTIVKRL